MPYKDIVEQKQSQRGYYEKNKGLYAESSRKARERKKAKLDALRNSFKCAKCGANHQAILDFHHQDPSAKEISIAEAMRRWGWEKVLKEIEKCVVLCSNCHRILHWEERQNNIGD